ncbi:hypothetical protein [Treponema endosymbiont of Eucomonympha sp.]|uniref:hypothetical protein n=1 Tax=Treponema endosymbiont of Eucomonympha sp. TaxID=1580831 RepID=UPI0035A11E98
MQSSPLPSSPPFMSGVCSSTFKSTLPRDKFLDLKNKPLYSGNEPSDLRNQHTDSGDEGGER